MGYEITKKESGDYIIKMWSNPLPAKQDFIDLGCDIVSYDRPKCDYTGDDNTRSKHNSVFAKTEKSTMYVDDMFGDPYTMIPSYNDNMKPVTADNRTYNAHKIPLYAVQSASMLYNVKVWYNGERVIIARLLRHRDTGKLVVFNVWGSPVGVLPARKRVKPAWIEKALQMSVTPVIDCVQFDAIRNATTEKRTHPSDMRCTAPNKRGMSFKDPKQARHTAPVKTTPAPDFGGCTF